MQGRIHKCLIVSVLAIFGVAAVISLSGCTDNPKDADAKLIRRDIAAATETITENADDEAILTAQNRIQSSIVQHSQADRETKDAALLASGNLSLMRARRMKSDLDLKTLPLRNSIDAFERSLRSAESTLIEKERIEGLLMSGSEEMDQLKQLISGSGERAGLQAQLKAAQAELTQLQDEKQQEQARKDKTQSILDDYQARADDLLRKAELTEGDARLKLEKQGYAILKDRKQYYIDAQASEDKIATLDSRIELTQMKSDNLEQSIQQTRGRIDDIETSDTRSALQRQLREAQQTLGVKQQQLVGTANAINENLKAFQQQAQTVCDAFQEAVTEFEKVRSSGAAYTARLQQAESYHHAAQACVAALRVRIDLAIRLEDLLKTADPTFANAVQNELPMGPGIDTRQAQNALDLYDKAIEGYQSAYDMAGQIGDQAQCSMLKSQLLAVDGKMKLAERVNMPTVADEAQAQCQELKEKGQEFGVSFTQSQTLKLVDSGIDFKPSLPVNLDVLAEQLATELSAWKRLPLEQQAVAVEANLARVDKLISQYGQTLADKLEPYRQEMVNAQQRGFEEPQPGASGPGEPNGF